jgi:sec-independent protein translocase protein TatA
MGLNALILKKISKMNSTVILAFLGMPEIILILLVVLLLFGGKKIPELMRGIGRGVREFNDAKDSVKNEIRKGMEEDPKADKS